MWLLAGFICKHHKRLLVRNKLLSALSHPFVSSDSLYRPPRIVPPCGVEKYCQFFCASQSLQFSTKSNLLFSHFSLALQKTNRTLLFCLMFSSISLHFASLNVAPNFYFLSIDAHSLRELPDNQTVNFVTSHRYQQMLLDTFFSLARKQIMR